MVPQVILLLFSSCQAIKTVKLLMSCIYCFLRSQGIHKKCSDVVEVYNAIEMCRLLLLDDGTIQQLHVSQVILIG